MVGKADPLRLNVPLVDKQGVPTREFVLFLNQVYRKVIAPDPDIPDVPPPPDYTLVEDWPLFAEYAENSTIPIILEQAADRQFIKLIGVTAQGNCTVTVYRNATPMAALAVTTTKSSVTFGVDCLATDVISYIITLASGVQGLALNLHSTRVLVPPVDP
jgi:hypothetical protein